MQQKATNKNYPRAVKALLEHRTIGEAAEAIGFNRATLYRYLKDDEFVSQLREAEGHKIDKITRRLVALGDKALYALESVLHDPAQRGASNRRLAATAILDQVVKLRELRNVEQRLTELEKAVQNVSR